MERRKDLRECFPGLADGRCLLLAGFAQGVRPTKRRKVSQWAADERWVSAESGSPYALGRDVRWLNENAPHLVEVMDCLSLDHPATEVSLQGSAQIAKTEAGVNLIGQIIDEDPSPILVLLPSLDEQKKYGKVKLQPTIDATPALRAKVRDQKSRDEDGSTGALKKFRGGFAVIATASSSKALQMVSYRIIIGEEIAEWPLDVGGRGDPMDQAIARTKAWRETKGAKVYWNSTPGLKGQCRISKKFEAGDQRRRYVPCPHCGAYQLLVWKNMRHRQDKPPYGAYFVCAAGGCGRAIEAHHRDWMVSNERAVWLKCYPQQEHDDDGVVGADIGPPGEVVLPHQLHAYRERGSGGRQPSFKIWQAYSLTVSWDATVGEFLGIQGDREKEKAFTQQGLGEAHEEKGDAPDAAKLVALVESFPLRQLPPGALFMTGFCDVQGHALKWCLYAWGRAMEHWRIDGGTIEGDPTDDGVWTQLSQVIRRRYLDEHGQAWPIDAFGVDTGYLSHRVYKFVRDQKRAGYEKVFATDGRGGINNAQHPPIGTPKKVGITWKGQKQGNVLLWPIGTWPMKLECYGALSRLLRSQEEAMGPDGQPWSGLPHFGEDCDLTFFQELTAEYLHIVDVRGKPTREWRKTGVNDRLDCYVGARALAAHVIGEAGMRDADWDVLAASRKPRPIQGSLLEDLPMRIKVATAPVSASPASRSEDPTATTPPPTPARPMGRKVTRSAYLGR